MNKNNNSNFFSFFHYVKLGWSSEVSALLRSGELPQNVQGAEEMMQTHQELKAELVNKEQQFESIQNLGRSVISSTKTPDEITDRMQQLTQELALLKDVWEKRNKELKQSNDLQVRIHHNCSLAL